MIFFNIAFSISSSHVAYLCPSSFFGLSIPLSFNDIIPEVLCCIIAATAVTGTGLSFEKDFANVS